MAAACCSVGKRVNDVGQQIGDDHAVISSGRVCLCDENCDLQRLEGENKMAAADLCRLQSQQSICAWQTRQLSVR